MSNQLVYNHFKTSILGCLGCRLTRCAEKWQYDMDMDMDTDIDIDNNNDNNK